MITLSEAEAERSDALSEMEENGAPILVRYDKKWNEGTGRLPPEPDYVDVETWGVFVGLSSQNLDGNVVIARDVEMLVADKGLESLEGLPGAASGNSPLTTGYEIYEGDPESHPSSSDPGVRRYEVVRLLKTTKLGGWPVLHRLHLRGG